MKAFLSANQQKQYDELFHPSGLLMSKVYDAEIAKLAKQVRHCRKPDWSELAQTSLTIRQTKLMELRDEAAAREESYTDFISFIRDLSRQTKTTGAKTIPDPQSTVECWADE